MSETIHLLIRLSEDGKAYATSPQAPGLVYGRKSLEELRRDLQEVLSFHFNQPGPFDVVEHHERHHDIAGHELVTRIVMDQHRAARFEVLERLAQVMSVPEQAKSLLSAVTNTVGEVVYVCAIPSDTIGWLTAQLSPHGDALNAAVTIADHMLLALPFAHDDGTRPEFEHFQGGPDTKLSEIIQKSPVVTPSQVGRLLPC